MCAYSTIKRKNCKCSDSCNLMPTTSWGGYNYRHAPAEMKEKMGLKAHIGYQNKRAAQNKAVLASKLHKAANGTKNELSLSEGLPVRSGGNTNLLMGIADKVFGDWVKKRDSDHLNFIKCPCCGKRFHLNEKNEDGESVVNVLHFVVRTVYSERYNPNNCFAGDNICNLKMHTHKTGKEYQNYRKFLVDKLGEQEVMRMENARRNINKLSEGDLRDIISKYSLT